MKSKIGRSPAYLVRNPYTYCFRMNVPKDLQPYIGKKELRYSLKTGYLATAKYKARIMAGQVQLIFKFLRKGNKALEKLSDKQIQEIVQKYLKSYIDGLEERWYSDDQPTFTLFPDLFFQYVRDLDYVKEDIIIYLGTRDYSTVERIVDDLFKENGIKNIDKSSVTYQKLCRGILRAQLKGIDIEKKQMLGDYSDDDSYSTVQNNTAATTAKQIQTSEEISKIAEEFWNWGVSEREWKPTSQLDFRRALDHFIGYFGKDTQVHTIEFLDMKKYKDGLVGKGLGVRTVGFYLGRAKAFFNYAKQYKHLDRKIDNPVSGLIPKDSRRKDTLSDIFEKEDLEKLFCKSKEYLEDKHTKPENFWIPLIALFTGCRREEICQLYIEDVKNVDGIWVLDINENAVDKRIKTGDERLVPLHPFLTNDLKFVDYVNGIGNKEVRIFHRLKRIKYKYGHSLGNWFRNFKKRSGIIAQPRKKTFHSFRHLVINHLLQKDVPVHVIKQLVGHSDKSITTGVYGKRLHPKKLLSDVVMKLDYEVDLTHLKNSKYVIKD